MQLGVHLPLIDFGRGVPDGSGLRDYTRLAAELGFGTVSTNDHLVWKRPWLDGPTALASVAGAAGGMTLATSVALVVVRHPVVVASALTALGMVTDGPVVAGLGPGSSAEDYRAVGVPFDERWPRFDEAFALVRALVRGEPVPQGRYYGGDGLRLDPLPTVPPEIWAGSWGSDARMRALAAVADGWMASAYNTTPEQFEATRARLDDHLRAAGRDPAGFPDLVATSWLYVSEDAGRVHHVLHDLLGPTLGRDPAELARRLPVGTAEHCVEILGRFAAAGAHRLLLWPVLDPVAQLEVVAEAVAPALPGSLSPQ